jgi:hypothetical protein
MIHTLSRCLFSFALFHSCLILIQVKFDLTIRYIYSMTTFVLKRRVREKKKNTNIKSIETDFYFQSIEIEIDFYFSTQSKYNRLASWNTNGITITNKSIVGEYSSDIFVNPNNTIHVIDCKNDQIQIWFDENVNSKKTMYGTHRQVFSIVSNRI